MGGTVDREKELGLVQAQPSSSKGRAIGGHARGNAAAEQNDHPPFGPLASHFQQIKVVSSCAFEETSRASKDRAKYKLELAQFALCCALHQCQRLQPHFTASESVMGCANIVGAGKHCRGMQGRTWLRHCLAKVCGEIDWTQTLNLGWCSGLKALLESLGAADSGSARVRRAEGITRVGGEADGATDS